MHASHPYPRPVAYCRSQTMPSPRLLFKKSITIVYGPWNSSQKTGLSSLCLPSVSLSLSSFRSSIFQIKLVEFYAGISSATMKLTKCQSFRFSLDRSIEILFGFAFGQRDRLGCFMVGTVLQIIANAASNCLTICSNKPSACHSFDDIFGRLT